MLLDLKASLLLMDCVKAAKALATHKPTLKDKRSMESYQKAMNAYGKACFDANDVAGYVVEYV